MFDNIMSRTGAQEYTLAPGNGGFSLQDPDQYNYQDYHEQDGYDVHYLNRFFSSGEYPHNKANTINIIAVMSAALSTAVVNTLISNQNTNQDKPTKSIQTPYYALII